MGSKVCWKYLRGNAGSCHLSTFPNTVMFLLFFETFERGLQGLQALRNKEGRTLIKGHLSRKLLNIIGNTIEGASPLIVNPAMLCFHLRFVKLCVALPCKQSAVLKEHRQGTC